MALYGMPYDITRIKKIAKCLDSPVIGICLPSGPYVSDENVKYIVDSIKAAIVS